MRKFHVVAIALGVGLLSLLIYEIGPASIWQRLAMLGWGFVLLMLLDGVTEVFHTLGWRRCLFRTHRSMPFAKIFSIRLAGSSINHLTPTAGFGGEVTKGVLLSSNRKGVEAAASVIVDKLSVALAQLVFVTGGALAVVSRVDLPVGLWVALVSGTSILAAGVIGFLIVQKYGKLGAVVRWAAAHRIGGKGLRAAALHTTEVDEKLRTFYRACPYDLPISVLWHTVALFWSVLPAFCFLFFVEGGAAITVATAIVCLGVWFNLVTFALPVDFGVQETSRVVIFNLLGFQSAAGLTYGITLRLEQLVWAGVGLAVYGILVARLKKGKSVSAAGDAGECRKGPEDREATWRRG